MIRLLRAMLVAAAPCVAFPLPGQAPDLPRLVAQYRSGAAGQAIEGLQQLLRVAATNDQRALTELHLGLALLRIRPAEAPAFLRRSIALDPDLQLDPGATPEDRAAWTAARSEMPVPTELRIEPGALVLGASDSLGISVTASGRRLSARARLRIVRPGFRDTIAVWVGRTNVTSRWDGLAGGTSLPPGRVQAIVEVDDDASNLVIQWPRTLDVMHERVTEPLQAGPRPEAPALVRAVTIVDRDAGARTLKRGGRWLAVGLGLVALSSALVPTAIDYFAAGSAPRWGIASAYAVGLATTAGGILYIGSRLAAPQNSTIMVPDEPALRQYRAALASWSADSAKIETLNSRLSELVRVTVRVGGSR